MHVEFKLQRKFLYVFSILPVYENVGSVQDLSPCDAGLSQPLWGPLQHLYGIPEPHQDSLTS